MIGVASPESVPLHQQASGKQGWQWHDKIILAFIFIVGANLPIILNPLQLQNFKNLQAKSYASVELKDWAQLFKTNDIVS